ncbi:AsnC family transcriptional regulator [Natronomonas sp. F2-12]|jgi:DNA-binding Lrp family transcriptional regulator|uniref:AsnC family transcriptional regulator n=1 Tax=Natronomonas aquatica TaxID=2841590 RepID=A0A9R1CNM3_9EURY|nr:AsnC family transcriptional regulator [Natronomonas aquatica]MCQ4332119.1 AsnC family transcriptional regulator [Natronomonas aquatica]
MTKSLDEQLVAALCRNGRADVRDLAAATDAAPTAVQKRLAALEERGTIEGYAATIDYSQFGYETVIFRLVVELGTIDEVTARLREQPSFVTVYQMSDTDTVFAVGKFGTEAAMTSCLCGLHDDTDIRRVETDRVRSVQLEGGSPIVDG